MVILVARNLELLDATWILRRLLVMETALVHIVRAIGILVRVPHLVINLASMLATWRDWNDIGNSHIPVGLGHPVYCVYATKLSRGVCGIIICQKVPMVSIIACHHGCSVLIGDGCLGSGHPLFFFVDSCAVLDIRIVSIVTLLFLSLVSDEHNVRLVDSCLI